MDDSIDMILEKDFNDLIEITINVGNSLAGKPNATKSAIYAEGLGQKVISHVLSAKYLYGGSVLKIRGSMSKPFIDFASIFVLTRAAIETYLTFNYLFISPKSPVEHEFRLLCWDLSGCLERAKIEAKDEEHIQKKNEEAKSIIELTEIIKNHEYYKALSEYMQGRSLRGDWRLKKDWSDLALESGFKKDFFEEQYKFLCGYAHSNKLSIVQIQQTKGIDNQRLQARGFIPLLKMVLAKYLYDYVNFTPMLKEAINLSEPKYSSVILWRDVALKGKEIENEYRNISQ
jgi:hypothetical protein